MRFSTVLASVLMIGIGAGCGSRTLAGASKGSPGHSQVLTKPNPIPKSRTTDKSSKSPVSTHTACYPAWERQDIRLAAQTRLPVPTTTIMTNLGNGPRLTTTTLSEWFGKSADTRLTVGSLLQGWSVHGSMATSSIGRVELFPIGNGPVTFGYSGFNIVLAERRPTPGQVPLLKGVGMPTRGPITLLVQIPKLSSSTTLMAAMQYMVTQIKSGAGLPLAIAITISEPAPTRYLSDAGPIQPKTLLMPTIACSRGVGWVLGIQKGLIVPLNAPFATDANGIRLGFAAGAVILDNNDSGYDTVHWFQEPGVSVPTKF